MAHLIELLVGEFCSCIELRTQHRVFFVQLIAGALRLLRTGHNRLKACFYFRNLLQHPLRALIARNSRCGFAIQTAVLLDFVAVAVKPVVHPAIELSIRTAGLAQRRFSTARLWPRRAGRRLLPERYERLLLLAHRWWLLGRMRRRRL